MSYFFQMFNSFCLKVWQQLSKNWAVQQVCINIVLKIMKNYTNYWYDVFFLTARSWIKRPFAIQLFQKKHLVLKIKQNKQTKTRQQTSKWTVDGSTVAISIFYIQPLARECFFSNHHMKFSIYTKFTMWKLLRVTINMGAEVKCESLPHTQCCAVNFHYHAKKIVPKENTDYPCSCNVWLKKKTQEPSCLGKLLSRFKDIKLYICDLFCMVIGN